MRYFRWVGVKGVGGEGDGGEHLMKKSREWMLIGTFELKPKRKLISIWPVKDTTSFQKGPTAVGYLRVTFCWYKGYYMPARGYEFYLRVFNSISHEWAHYINTSEIPSELSRTICYVTISTVISSRVKTACHFHVWRYEVFARKLTWYFTGVYIIRVV